MYFFITTIFMNVILFTIISNHAIIIIITNSVVYGAKLESCAGWIFLGFLTKKKKKNKLKIKKKEAYNIIYINKEDNLNFKVV